MHFVSRAERSIRPADLIISQLLKLAFTPFAARLPPRRGFWPSIQVFQNVGNPEDLAITEHLAN
jgi:hypothetical protein